jgi:hypothetical protein
MINHNRRNRWQIVSDDSVWMFPPDTTLSTVELPVLTVGDWALYEGTPYESCIFFANGDSDVIARYKTKEEAIAGHVELEKKYGLKRCSKLKMPSL